MAHPGTAGRGAQYPLCPAMHAAGKAARAAQAWLSGLLSLLVALVGLQLAASAPALAAEHSWGSPPAYDYVVPLGQTARHAGWQRFYSPQEYVDFAGCNGELVFVAGKYGLQAVDVATGELRWSYGRELSFSGEILQYARDYVIANIHGNPTALDLRDGHQLWQADWWAVLGSCSEGLWFADRAEQSESGDWFPRRIGIAEPRTGKVRQSFAIDPAISLSSPVLLDASAPFLTGSQPVLAVQQGAEIHAYGPQGLLWTCTLADELDYVQMCSVPEGLLLCEYREYRHLLNLAGAETDPKDNALAEALGWSLEPAATSLSYRLQLLNPQTGEVLWNAVVDAEETGPHYGDVLQGGAGRSVLALETWIELPDGSSRNANLGQVIDNTTGELPGRIDTDTSFSRTDWQAARRNWPLPIERDLEMKCSYPPLVNDRIITLPGGVDPFQGVWLDHRFVVLSEVREAGADNSGYEVLYGLQLDDDNTWLAGEPQRFGFQQRDESTAKRFLASPDPLADDALMRELVESGKTSFMAAAGHFAEMDRRHRDALFELALYLEQHADRSSSLTSPVNELILSQYGRRCIVHENASPALTPMLIDWYKRPDTGFYRNWLVGMIAVCGGPAAREFLDGIYDVSLEQSFSPAQPPFKVPTTFRDPAEKTVSEPLELANGDSVVACIDEGLTGRDIVLLVDHGTDGSYDECLPTGLTDVHARWYFPGGVDGEPEMATQISLELLDGSEGGLRIGHHVLAEDAPMSFDESGSGETGVSFEQDELLWSELRLDSDGDGLTDITERYTFTDPQQADSDGDGLDDGHDRYPNTDMSACSAVERGIVRAMQIDRLREYDKDPQKGTAAGAAPLHPFDLRYFALSGMLRLPAASSASERCIMLTTEQQQEQYYALLNNYNGFTIIHAGLEEIGPDGRRLGGDFMFPSRDQDVHYEGQYIVHLDYTGAGDEIELIEVEGEYYPVASVGGWIS